ncbi:MAG: hypothetical protein HY777_07015 [Betaproteobacteria bacterium]|nr:hypothetical protein [Betaproteobacteria bacterium]
MSAPRGGELHPERLKGDIACIRMRHGFLYPCAIPGRATRKVLAWRLSNTLAGGFCTAAPKEAVARCGTPEIFNAGQGCQSTGAGFAGALKEAEIRISADGRVYLRPCNDGIGRQRSPAQCFGWYGRLRPHRPPEWETPDEACSGALAQTRPAAARTTGNERRCPQVGSRPQAPQRTVHPV